MLSAENIMLELEEIVDQWGLLRSKLAAVVTDNKKHIVRAINDLVSVASATHCNCQSKCQEYQEQLGDGKDTSLTSTTPQNLRIY